MTKPFENKTEEMKDAIEATFPGTKKLVAEYKCPLCKNPIGKFRDALSQKEYQISGMCQVCQDSIWGSGNE
jgi:hypothetical protein